MAHKRFGGSSHAPELGAEVLRRSAQELVCAAHALTPAAWVKHVGHSSSSFHMLASVLEKWCFGAPVEAAGPVLAWGLATNMRKWNAAISEDAAPGILHQFQQLSAASPVFASASCAADRRDGHAIALLAVVVAFFVDECPPPTRDPIVQSAALATGQAWLVDTGCLGTGSLGAGMRQLTLDICALLAGSTRAQVALFARWAQAWVWGCKKRNLWSVLCNVKVMWPSSLFHQPDRPFVDTWSHVSTHPWKTVGELVYVLMDARRLVERGSLSVVMDVIVQLTRYRHMWGCPVAMNGAASDTFFAHRDASPLDSPYLNGGWSMHPDVVLALAQFHVCRELITGVYPVLVSLPEAVDSSTLLEATQVARAVLDALPETLKYCREWGLQLVTDICLPRRPWRVSDWSLPLLLSGVYSVAIDLRAPKVDNWLVCQVLNAVAENWAVFLTSLDARVPERIVSAALHVWLTLPKSTANTPHQRRMRLIDGLFVDVGSVATVLVCCVAIFLPGSRFSWSLLAEVIGAVLDTFWRCMPASAARLLLWQVAALIPSRAQRTRPRCDLLTVEFATGLITHCPELAPRLQHRAVTCTLTPCHVCDPLQKLINFWTPDGPCSPIRKSWIASAVRAVFWRAANSVARDDRGKGPRRA